MQLKASTDYGLRAVLYLAHMGETCSSKDIAEAMLIPRDYLIQLAQLLRRAGIVDARPGKNGGYKLAKPPEVISLYDVMRALEADTRTTAQADRGKRLEEAAISQQIREAYERAISTCQTHLNTITIASLLE